MEWRLGWTARWKKRHCVPWSCELCHRENAYRTESCVQCGKKAPLGANKRIEDGAAAMIQRIFRTRKARKLIRDLCQARFGKKFDRKTGEVFYVDLVSGNRLERKPVLLGSCDVEMDEREEVAYKEFLEKMQSKKRLKMAFEEREALRRVDREERAMEEERKRIAEIESRWAAPFIQAERTGELIANWQKLVEIHPRVYELGPSLTMLRLIGNPFVRLPGSLFTSLTNIKILSLSNCSLVELPYEITELKTLTDLNLIGNKLKHLPDNIGNLTQLESLLVTSNELVDLPLSFAKLKNLPRLNLEQNFISLLPDNIVELQCRIYSLGKMSLRQLPSQLGDFGTTIVSLSADHNKIRRIPKSIGKLVNLQHLSLCDNQIRLIPDEICDCVNLRRLWLDWNKIEELPADFLKLDKLESLHLEGNPMRVPHMNIVVEGVQALRDWFVQSVDFYIEKERKEICQQLQNVLATMHDENLHDPAFYEPGFSTVEIGERHDLYHAFVPEYLFAYVIPTWNKFVEEMNRNPDVAQRKLEGFISRKLALEAKEQEEYELQEKVIIDTLNAEDDANALLNEANKEEDEEDEEDEDEEETKGEGDGLKKRKKKTLREELEDEKEQEEIEKRRKQAEIRKQLEQVEKKKTKSTEELRLERTNAALAKVNRAFALFEYTEEEVKDAIENYKDQYGAIFAYDQVAQFRRCKCQRDGEPRLCVPPSIHFRCERKATFFKIKMVTYLEKLRFDSINLEDESLEERVQIAEKEAKAYVHSGEGIAFFRVMAVRETRRILEEERKERFILKQRMQIERKRRKDKNKRDVKIEKLQQAKQKRTRELNQKKNKLVAILERSKGWEAKECSEKIADIDDELNNHPQDVEIEILETDQEIANDKFKNLSHADRLLERYKGPSPVELAYREARYQTFARRLLRVREKLIDAYVQAQKKRVTLEIRREFRITRRIMFNWLHLNVRITFQAWYKWAKSQIFWKKRLVKEGVYNAELEEASKQVEIQYKQAERAKWIENIDPFSDKKFWQHNETLEVRWDEPQLDEMHYIPRQIPIQ